MAYTVEFTFRARRQLAALEADAQRRIASAVDGLAENPRPDGCEKLRSGDGDRYRICIGRYRAIYQVEDNGLRLLVVVIGHRRNVYR